MSHQPASSHIPKTPALFSRKEATGLAKRFLKSNDLFEAQRDLMIIYKLVKQYPSRPFWENYSLPFQLNSLFWFLGKDGQDQLSRDWSLFNLDLGKQDEPKFEETKQGEDIKIERKIKTIADLLKSS